MTRIVYLAQYQLPYEGLVVVGIYGSENEAIEALNEHSSYSWVEQYEVSFEN